MTFRRLLVLTGCLALATVAAAADFTWSLRQWQSDDGLPNNTITGLAQTSDGYLWIASPGPLVRFDGNTFEQILPSQIVPNYRQNARAILAARNGSLWIAMAHGPIFCIGTNNAVEIFTNNLPDLIVQRFVEDAEAGIWTVYPNGEIRRLAGGGVRGFSTADGWPAGYAGSLACDGKGRLWFAKSGEVGQFDHGRFKTLFRTGTSIAQIAGRKNGGVWLCSSSNLFQADEGTPLRAVGALPVKGPDEPTVLFESRDGDLWIGTANDGLFRYNPDGFQKVSAYPQILSLAEDAEGNIWAGTAGDGLIRIRPSAVKLENEEDQSPFGAVRSLCEDTGHNLWATTERGRLIQRTDGHWNQISNWVGGLALCVAADDQGGVWVAGRNALYRWKAGQWEQREQNAGSMAERIYALTIARNGDVWVAGSTLHTLRRLHAGEWHSFNLPRNANYVRAMAEDAAGNIWIGTSRGTLLRIRGDAVFDETTNVFGLPISVRGLCATPDGSLWIACAGGGLCWLDRNGRAARLMAEQGLYDNYLSQVIADDQGWLWFGSDHGIFKARQQAFADVAAGRTAAIQCIHYGRSAGLPSLQANFGHWPDVLRSHDGLLWLPMRTALAVIDPRNGTETFRPPPAYLTRVRVDGALAAAYGRIVPARAPVDLSAPREILRLPPRHYRLEFDYTAINFRAPENVNFRYQLEGFDNGWIEAGEKRTANYSRLPAGNYHFQVQARMGDGEWSQAAVLPVYVTPFLWQTWWFRLALLLAFTAGVIAAVRYISFRRLRHQLQWLERQTALDRERARIARDIHDDLGGSLTQIVLLSGLGQRDHSDPKKVGDYLQRISDTTHQVIRLLDEVVWAVNPRNDNLRDLLRYLGQFAVEFLSGAGIKCRLNLPEPIPARPISADVRHNLFMAAKEALNNVVRHARAGEVQVSAEITGSSLRLTIEDDGQGFGPAPDPVSADGLRNMRQRMEETGGHCEIESVPGKGTRVTFCVAAPAPNDLPGA